MGAFFCPMFANWACAKNDAGSRFGKRFTKIAKLAEMVNLVEMTKMSKMGRMARMAKTARMVE